MKEAKYYTVKELAAKEKIPEIFDTGAHLIYSSPATLAYNSPRCPGLWRQKSRFNDAGKCYAHRFTRLLWSQYISD